MKTHEDALIAMLLGDAPASPQLARWLATAAGRLELAAYRAALRALRKIPGDATIATARRTVYYDAVETPIGRVLVAATDDGLVRLAFRQREAPFVTALRQWLRAEVVRSPLQTADVVRQLRAYFAGRRRSFDLPLDLGKLTSFQRRVLRAAARVPAGRVVSYGDLARRIGQPRGSRAVGQALGRNPVPIVVPCHRVVASGGGLGGYTGGLDIKRKLLRLEGALAAGGSSTAG